MISHRVFQCNEQVATTMRAVSTLLIVGHDASSTIDKHLRWRGRPTAAAPTTNAVPPGTSVGVLLAAKCSPGRGGLSGPPTKQTHHDPTIFPWHAYIRRPAGSLRHL